MRSLKQLAKRRGSWRGLGWLVLAGLFLLGACPPVPGPVDGGGREEKKESLAPPPLLQGPLTRWVDPMIATGGQGFGVGSALPGATVPFGLVKVSPDTGSAESGVGFNLCAGYTYSSTTLLGFSHIHLHGTGVPDYGNLLVVPVVDAITPKKITEEGYRSRFQHTREKAEPGYYAVHLDDPDVFAELTASTRTAYHRYTFPKSARERYVLLRLDHALPGGSVSDAQLEVKGEREVSGWLHSQGGMSKRHGGFRLYFVLRSRQAFVAGTWREGKLAPQATSQQGAAIGAYLRFSVQDNPVELQVGLSFVSVEQARKNLEKEQRGWDFAGTRAAAKKAWEELLGRVRIAGGTEKERRIFYTALYHVYQMPTIFTDVDGQYRGLDKKVHRAKDFVYYSDFSLWDTYRTFHPLLVLLAPGIQRDMVRSLLQMAREGGYLPRWPLATGYTGTMVGASADIVIADTYLKGIRGFDIEFAYQAMRELALKPTPPGAPFGGRSGIEHYVKKGYVAADKKSGAASVTQEYAYNDFAIAQLARALGKKDDVTLFLKRSKNYRHLWDAKSQFFRAKRSDGSWLPNWKPDVWSKDYVEGNAWHYLWFVPHDVPGLVDLFGGKEALLEKLNTFFERSRQETEQRPQSSIPRVYYWHGNEPDIHTATLYLELGRAGDAYRWLRWIMKTRYDDTPAGLPGNDDGGTLSSWYVFNAMGLYPLPGADFYWITSPLFPRISLQIEGKTIEIIAEGLSEKKIYVHSATLNGKPLSQPRVRHQDLVKDRAVLRLKMGDTPRMW